MSLGRDSAVIIFTRVAGLLAASVRAFLSSAAPRQSITIVCAAFPAETEMPRHGTFTLAKNHRKFTLIPAFVCELDLLHLSATSHCHRGPSLRASVQPPCSLGSGWRRKAASHQQYQAGVKLWLRFPPGSPSAWGLAGDVGVSQLPVWQGSESYSCAILK